MSYTIGQVAQRFSLPVSTLRYYDKEGLFPELERIGGIRRFHEQDVEVLRVIECLKKSGLEIKDIKQFIQWCGQGEGTYPERLELFKRQKEKVLEEITMLKQTLDMINFKCWYYEQLCQGKDSSRLLEVNNPEMPAEIRQAYLRSHS